MSQDRVAKNRWRLAYRIIVGFVAAYAVLGFLIVPFIAKQQALSFIEQRLGGASQIEAITLNPFSFNVEVLGMQLSDPDARPLVSFDSVRINYQLTSLLFGEIAFSEIAVDGFHASLRRRADGGNNIDDLLQRWSASAAAQETEELSPSDGSTPAVRIDTLRVSGASLGLEDEAVSPPFQTLIESIDFSLNELSTNTSSAAAQRLTLSIGEGSQLSWSGTLSLAPVQSSGQVHLVGPLPRLAYRYFQEQIPVLLAGGWFDASLEYHFLLSEAGEPDLKIQQLEAALTELTVRDRQSNELLLGLPMLSVQGASLDLLQQQVMVERVLVDRLQVEAERSVDGVLNLQAAFSTGEQSATVQNDEQNNEEQAAPWTIRLDELALQDWDLRVRDFQVEPALDISVAMNSEVANISNIADQAMQIDADVNVSSGGSLSVGGQLTLLPEAAFSGQLDLSALALPVLQPYVTSFARVQLEDGSLSIAGRVEASGQESEFSGNASIDSLLIRDTLENEDLFALGSLAFEETLVSIGQEDRVHIETINVLGPYARIEIEEDGSNNISRVLVEPSEETAASQVPPDAEQGSSLPELRIAQIKLALGGADFSDRSLPLPFAVRIDGLAGEVSTLSSSSSEPARINLEGQVDEFGLAAISGRLRPLDYAALTEIDLAFSNLNIPSLSPYVIKFAGRTIADGALDVELSYRINDSKLNGENAMVMRGLVLGERIDHPDALDLPLGLAIALLKDGNGVIDLDVPVTGDINSPQFNYGNVVRTALGNIIRNIVSSPFKFLASLVGGDEESDIGVIEFVPGRFDLQPPQREKLVQLADALVQRPQLRLDLLGRYAGSADSEVLREQFFEERFSLALSQVDSDIEPTLQRLQLLEQFTLEQAPQGSDAALNLLSLRQEHTQVDAAGESQFDDLAYAQSLRRRLIAQEEVAIADLERLASARVNAIAQALSDLEASLASRIQSLPTQEEVALEGGSVPLALELSSL